MAHIVSLPINGGGQPKFLHSDDPAVIARWIEAENRPGYGIYDILNPLVPGARTQGRENMRGVLFLFVDVDCKDVVEPRAEVERHLRNLALRPTWLNDSGHGFHVIYRFKEEIERGTPEFDRAQAFQEQLIRYLAGDPKVRLWSLLRRPGTINFKEEPFVQCRTILTGAPVDFTEMEAFCELVAGATLLTNKVGPDPRDDGEVALKASVDAEQRLANMRWHGAGNSSIDITRNDVMASLLNSGVCLTEATDIILAAVRACVAGDPAAASWDWHAEYLRTAYNGATLINKDHTLVHLLPDDLRTKFQEMDQDGLGPVIKKNAYKLFVYPTATAAGGKKGPSAPAGKPGTATLAGKFTLRPFVPFDLATLPPREWLYGRHYQRHTVSATVAPGGFGKTTLCMVEGVAMATVRNLLGEQPTERLRVWYHNGEDSREELNRRLGAICLHYGIPQEELSGWFFMTSGNEVPLRVANGYGELKIDNNLIRGIEQEIVNNQIDVAVLDPLVTLHSVSEQDNNKMDTVVRIFGSIADTQSCSVELAHHTRKLLAGSTSDYVVDDMRGASAIKDAVRAARMLNQMMEKDAEEVGIPEHERSTYFRVDRVKGNNAPPAKAVWRHFVNVELPNGDDVGVVVPWDFPGQGAPSTQMAEAEKAADHVFLALLTRLTLDGRAVSHKVGPNYAPAVFAQEPEAKSASVSKRRLVDAMRRLFHGKRIRAEVRDRKGRESHVITLV